MLRASHLLQIKRPALWIPLVGLMAVAGCSATIDKPVVEGQWTTLDGVVSVRFQMEGDMYYVFSEEKTQMLGDLFLEGCSIAASKEMHVKKPRLTVINNKEFYDLFVKIDIMIPKGTSSKKLPLTLNFPGVLKVRDALKAKGSTDEPTIAFEVMHYGSAKELQAAQWLHYLIRTAGFGLLAVFLIWFVKASATNPHPQAYVGPHGPGPSLLLALLGGVAAALYAFYCCYEFLRSLVASFF